MEGVCLNLQFLANFEFWIKTFGLGGTHSLVPLFRPRARRSECGGRHFTDDHHFHPLPTCTPSSLSAIVDAQSPPFFASLTCAFTATLTLYRSARFHAPASSSLPCAAAANKGPMPQPPMSPRPPLPSCPCSAPSLSHHPLLENLDRSRHRVLIPLHRPRQCRTSPVALWSKQPTDDLCLIQVLLTDPSIFTDDS
jgi:hypothetical protein